MKPENHELVAQIQVQIDADWAKLLARWDHDAAEK
jgi:hypothetical protein